MFCKNCGTQIEDDSKFCNNCGAEIIKEKKSQYVGEVKKCPNCGAVIKSFQVKCDVCGFEFRGTKAATSLDEFSKKIFSFDELKLKNNSISDVEINDLKISYISGYAIPNNKEEILEFMIIASSNINTSNVSDKNYNTIDPLNQAWISKMEQAYEKANLTIGNTEEFKRIEKIYYDKKTQVSNLTKKIAARRLLIPFVLAIGAISIFIGFSDIGGSLSMGFMMFGEILLLIASYSVVMKPSNNKKKNRH